MSNYSRSSLEGNQGLKCQQQKSFLKKGAEFTAVDHQHLEDPLPFTYRPIFKLEYM